MLSSSLDKLLSLLTLISVLAVCQSAEAITRIGNAQLTQKKIIPNTLQAARGFTFPYQNNSPQPDVLKISNQEQVDQKIVITRRAIPKGDSFSLSNSKIIGKYLKIEVFYSGGCKQHNFNLYWNGAYQESFPPQVRMRLVHDAKKESCERLVKETLIFDLQNLRPSIIRLTTSFSDSTSIDYTK